MTDRWDEPGRYEFAHSQNPKRRVLSWDWSVRDNATGIERFGRASSESWARHDADRALRKMRGTT